MRQLRCQYNSAGMFSADTNYLFCGSLQRWLGGATHTLVHLELGGDVHYPELALAGGHFIDSLKSFQVLKSIRFGGTMFIESLESEQESHDLSIVKQPGRLRSLIDIFHHPPLK